MRELYLITQVFHNCGRWNTKKVFCFHTFEPFRNLIWHHVDTTDEKVFVDIKFRKLVYMWYSSNAFELFIKLNSYQTVPDSIIFYQALSD